MGSEERWRTLHCQTELILRALTEGTCPTMQMADPLGKGNDFGIWGVLHFVAPLVLVCF